MCNIWVRTVAEWKFEVAENESTYTQLPQNCTHCHHCLLLYVYICMYHTTVTGHLDISWHRTLLSKAGPICAAV